MIKLSFIGDIALNDDYIELYKQGINPFSDVEFLLSQSDYVIGNLECIAMGNQGENVLKAPRLRTTVDTLNFLKKINVNIVSLAHNHVYDHLEDGFCKTVNFLDECSIQHFGCTLEGEIYKPIFIKKNGIKIGLLNYIFPDTNPKIPKNANIKLNLFDWDQAKTDIERLKKETNHVVLLLHWGGDVEGSMFPQKNQSTIAKKIIDLGADLIIGHHSHTLQPYEIYKNKYIFYSIGNFCFSDVIINGKRVQLDKKRTDPSVILDIKFDNNSYTVKQNGIINNNCIIKINEEKNSIIHKINFEKNFRYKSPIWFLHFTYEKKIYPIIAYFFANNRNPLTQISKLKWRSITNRFRASR